MKEKGTAPKGQSKFMQWYESYTGKKVVGCVYSLGASIVIVGALFKIMHFPGAGPMLPTNSSRRTSFHKQASPWSNPVFR